MEHANHLHFCAFLQDLIPRIPHRRDYIRSQILPMMDAHRGRERDATFDEILLKLFSTDEVKPGEMVELMNEIQLGRGRLTPQRASEVADIIYYTEQPGGRRLLYPEGEHEIPPDLLPLIEGTLGTSVESARMLCIVKYATRIRYNGLSKAELHVIEYDVLERFLPLRKITSYD